MEISADSAYVWTCIFQVTWRVSFEFTGYRIFGEREGVRGSAIKIRDSSCKLLSFPPLPSNETLITISSNNDIERWKWIFFFFLLHRGHSVTELERTGCASAEERAYLKAENGGWDAKSKEKENVENLPNLCTIFLKKNSLKGGTVRGSRSWGTETY